ncbi:metal ion permease [Brachionus plicatilis]|uniref:Metal ion permease n=1 Tax=Brachionus plicatilis TaxID=10195 RepID=A0A3M7SWQ2_BRAPC|nr:metal ion permease [Brachionus plicatilis]
MVEGLQLTEATQYINQLDSYILYFLVYQIIFYLLISSFLSFNIISSKRKKLNSALSRQILFNAVIKMNFNQLILISLDQINLNLRNLDSRMSNMETTVADIGTRMSNMETTVADIGTRMSNMEATVADIGTRMSNMEATVVETGTRMSNMEATVADIGTRMSNMEATVVETGTRMSNMEATVADIGTRMSNMEATVVETGTRMSNMERSVTNFQTELFDTANRVSRIEINRENQLLDFGAEQVQEFLNDAPNLILNGPGIGL